MTGESFDVIVVGYGYAGAAAAIAAHDAGGRALYPLSAPTWHDRAIADAFGGREPRRFDADILVEAGTIADLAHRLGLDRARLAGSVDAWNAACAAGRDDAYGRPTGSMMPVVEAPFSGAAAWPAVSNTQGGLAHDEAQRVLDAFGEPISGLWVAGELGSAFGHLSMSGGDIAECFVGGRLAGRDAMGRPARRATA